jgi:iron complex outermembrane recepter protein
MRTIINHRNLLRAAMLAGTLLATPAFAQGALPDTDEETGGPDIVVSAQRFEQRLKDTPIAVTAIDANTLADRQANNLRDIGALVPGLVIEGITGLQNAPRAFLRGVGQDSATFNADPGVGTYVDNVYVPRTYAGLFDFSDVERVEVLRGPQGTLYGRNTPGGAINILTRRPSFDLTGSAEVAYGSFNQIDARGYISGPISDELAVSVSVLHRERDGITYAPNIGGGTWVNNRLVNAQRLKLLIVPDNQFEFTLAFDHSQDNTGPFYPVAIEAPTLPQASPTRDLFVTDADTPVNNGLAEAWSGTFTGRYHVGGLTVTSISGYRQLRQNIVIPLSTIPNSNSFTGHFLDNYSLSQEFNAAYTTSAFDLVGGLYYFSERSKFQNRVGSNPIEQSKQDTESYAAYVQGTLKLTPQLGLIAGGRYTRERKPFWNYYPVATTAVPIRYPLTDTKAWDAFTPKLGIEFKPNEQILAYASYTKGFKAGGWNRISPSVQNGNLVYQLFSYDPEKIAAYEVGLKLESVDRRASLNVAGYWNDLSDLQVTQPITGTTIGRISNAARARVRGVEVEAAWSPVETLQLFGNAAYTDGGYRGAFSCTDRTSVYRNCSGKSLKGVAPWRALGGFTWKLPVPGAGGFRLGSTVTYTDKFYNDVYNNEITASKRRTLLDGFVSYTTENNRWTATLEGKNLTDKHYYATALAIGTVVVAYPNDPRTITGRIKYTF